MKKLLFTIFAPIILFTSPFIVGYLVIYTLNFFIEVPAKYFLLDKICGIGIFTILICLVTKYNPSTMFWVCHLIYQKNFMKM